MAIVTEAEFRREIDYYEARALIEPIVVTQNGCKRVVLISADQFYRLKKRERRVMTPIDFTDEDILALEKARAPCEAGAFNDEVPK